MSKPWMALCLSSALCVLPVSSVLADPSIASAASDTATSAPAVLPASEAVAQPAVVTAPSTAPSTAQSTESATVAAQPAPTPEAAAAPAPEVKLDKGDTAWMLISTALVLMMTIPGLALFYGGMVRRKNVLGTMMHSFAAAALVSVLWVAVGYSLAFSDASGSLAPYIGNLDKAFLSGVAVDKLWTDAAGTVYTIPETLFMVFQMTFAIITVSLMSGAIAERMKFGSFMVFVSLWVLAVYAPIAHWVWNADGWLFAKGALDFAGGTVVHINSGVAGLVAAYVVGRRVGMGREAMPPHNLTLTLIGAGMLWVGWFGFNAGSWLCADGRAAMAMVVTQVAAAMATLSWLAAERIFRGKASVLGAASGAVAGLVAITPASGYVGVSGALILGLVAGAVCFWGATGLKKLLKVDDSLDAFGVHGVGGMVGALLTGVLATEVITGGAPKIMPVAEQLWVQFEGVAATVIYSALMTFVLLKLVNMVMGLRVSEEEERAGLDVSQHGERVEG